MLFTLDKTIFEWINGTLSNPVFDFICPLLRNPYFWAPVYLLLLIYFIRKDKWKGLIFIAGILLTFAICDRFNSGVLKPYFNRLRPCHRQDVEVVKRVDCGLGKSFPSSHATNHWGISTFLALIFIRRRKKRWAYLCLVWAAAVCFSQVYVGVHFPIDIMGGTLEGILIGWGCAMLALFTLKKVETV